MKTIIASLLLIAGLSAQNMVRWAATTGDLSLSGASTATIQQPATNAVTVLVDQIVVYCSVNCAVTQAANGTGATGTAGIVTPILPSQLNASPNVTFWTSSNVGTGTAQGGIVHIPAGSTVTLCLSPNCGASTGQVTLGSGGGTGSNYSLIIGSISGTANITFYGRTSF